jgi:hypothetical protein
MLGSNVGTLRGKVIGRRMLAAVDSRPAFEATAELAGTLAGIDIAMTGTYQGTVQAEGWFGAINPSTNVTMAADGSIGVFQAWGTGRFTGPRSMKAGGLLYYTGASGCLAELNGKTIVFDYEIDEDDNVTMTMFDWA